jgi:hypothetical protein
VRALQADPVSYFASQNYERCAQDRSCTLQRL